MTHPTGLLSKYGWCAFLISLLVLLLMLVAGYRYETGPAVVLTFTSLAVYFMGHPLLRGVSFTIWVFAFVAGSLFYPGAFGTWFGFDLKLLILPLIQIIMFGMGTTLSVSDFTRVFTMPWPVFIGMGLQYSIMPLAGFAIAMAFGFEAEVAAGVILIGSCPGGVASNLMTYLAGGNVALSVTMTSCSTIASPLMTPFLMKVLAGQFVEIDFVQWMLNILNMIIVPIVAGLLANRILYSGEKWANRVGSLVFVSVVTGVVLIGATVFAGEGSLAFLIPLRSGIIIGSALVAVVALLKLLISVVFEGPKNWMDKALPIVSMAGICFIIAIITARSRQELLNVGLALIAAAVLHNLIGYVAGYWSARLAALDRVTCRTVAIEVGLQNGGMASGLAINVLKSAQAALAPAIFGPWMNISGSMLATWWHHRPVANVRDGDGKQ